LEGSLLLKENSFWLKDLNIGINIKIYDRVFRITDCDDFTKEFYKEMDIKLNAPDVIPKDQFLFHQEMKDAKIPPPDTKEYKEYFEVKLQGGHPNTGLKKYLENDRKVIFSIFSFQEFFRFCHSKSFGKTKLLREESISIP